MADRGVYLTGFFPALDPEIEADLKATLSAEWEAITGVIPDLSDESEIMAVLGPVRLLTGQLWRTTEATYYQGFAETSSGAGLIDRIADRILERKLSLRSTGFLRFTGTPAQSYSASTTEVESDTGVRYRPTRDFTINAFGDVLVPAISLTTGYSTRIDQNTINTVITPVGVTVDNTTDNLTYNTSGPDAGYITITATENPANYNIFTMASIRYLAAIDGMFLKLRNPQASTETFVLKMVFLDDATGNFLAATSAWEFDLTANEEKTITYTGEEIDLGVDPTVTTVRLVPVLMQESTSSLEFKTVVEAGTDQLYLNSVAQTKALDMGIVMSWEGDFIGGRDLESEAALKARRKLQLYKPGAGTVNSIAARLRDLRNADFVKVEENDSPVTDNNGYPPYSIVPIIYGDVKKREVAEVLRNTVHGGQPMHGNVEIMMDDPEGQPRKYKMFWVSEKTVYMRVTCNVTEMFDRFDGVRQVKDALIARFGGVDSLGRKNIGSPTGEDVDHSEAIVAVKAVQGVGGITVSMATDALFTDEGTGPIAIADTEKAILTLSSIDVRIIDPTV